MVKILIRFFIAIGAGVLFFPRKILALFTEIVRLINIYIGYIVMAFRLALIVLIGVALAYISFRLYSLYEITPAPRSFSDFPTTHPVHIYDRNGILLYRPIRINTSPTHISALPKDVQKTIAQQIKIRRVIPTLADYALKNEKDKETLRYRLKLIMVSLKLRLNSSNQMLLEHYLNIPFYNGVAQGMDNAALQLLNKHLAAVSRPEALFLTQLPISARPSMKSVKSTPYDYKRAAVAIDFLLSGLKEKYVSSIEGGKGLLVYTTLDVRLQNIRQSSLIEQSVFCEKQDCDSGIITADLSAREVLSVATIGNHLSKVRLERFYKENSLTSVLRITNARGESLYEKVNSVDEPHMVEYVFKNGKFIRREGVS